MLEHAPHACIHVCIQLTHASAESDLEQLERIDDDTFIAYQLYLKVGMCMCMCIQLTMGRKHVHAVACAPYCSYARWRAARGMGMPADHCTCALRPSWPQEWLFLRRDATSRATGTLAKNTIVLDMGGFSNKCTPLRRRTRTPCRAQTPRCIPCAVRAPLTSRRAVRVRRRHLSNARFKKLLTHKTVKTADEMYPQSLGTMVAVAGATSTRSHPRGTHPPRTHPRALRAHTAHH